MVSNFVSKACILWVLTTIVPARFANVDGPMPLDKHIRQMGYPCESHEITTEDGYVLTYHRIPHGRLVTREKRPPVLLQHAILTASSVWVTVNQSLGFVLADEGYDVWMGNSRGNEFARKHVWYDPDKDKEMFWDFSWHEMGYYDLPASIDYILNTTGYDQLSYVGHSMGTTIYFVLGATRPEYMSKINAGVLLAPVAFLKQVKSPIVKVLYNTQHFINAVRLLAGMYELLPYNDFMYWADHHICAVKDVDFVCRDILFLLVGFDQKELSKDLLAQYFDYMPGGTSFKTLLHYGQVINGDFKKFDYGFFKNIRKYHSVTPPSYNLQNVNAPTYFYVAPNDWLVNPNSAVESARAMPNLQGITMVNDPFFSHIDFIWAVDVKPMVYDSVVETLKRHNR